MSDYDFYPDQCVDPSFDPFGAPQMTYNDPGYTLPDSPTSTDLGPDGQPVSIDIRDKYQQQSFEALGLRDREQFDAMDMQERNKLISGAYAGMYLADPDTYKWAGMAAYTSSKVGEGMADAGALGMVSQIDGDEFGDSLEQGNKAIFDDIYWQHLAFQNGGVEELEKAAEQGTIAPAQLESWRALAAAQEARNQAMADGDDEALQAADAQVWAANKGLLRHEQEVVLQDGVYTDHAEMFEDMSSAWAVDIAGFASPIPGDDSDFEDYVEDGNIADFDDRWRWIEDQMLPAYQDRDGNHRDEMVEDMRALANRSRSGCFDESTQGGAEGGPGYYDPCPPQAGGAGGAGGAGPYQHYAD
jgi:hypothetical protein